MNAAFDPYFSGMGPGEARGTAEVFLKRFLTGHAGPGLASVSGTAAVDVFYGEQRQSQQRSFREIF